MIADKMTVENESDLSSSSKFGTVERSIPLTAPAPSAASKRYTGSTTKMITQRIEAPSTPPAPPNGGLKAWLQVLGAFLLFFNTW